MTERRLQVSTEFTTTPGPRKASEGDCSGEVFLNRHLQPKWEEAKNAGEVLLVDLDGTEGYATSFLEAAFGGLARTFGAEVVLRHLKLKSDEEPLLIDEINTYIREAAKE